jgi:uncharacterized protein (DUF2249 family)
MSPQAEEPIVDARMCGTAGCATMSMEAFDALPDGAAFVLVADHDPVGIRYMLEAERAGQSRWEALEEGPELWRTRIHRGEPGAIA